MFGILNFWAFIVAGIILNITPGADTMYILGRSISQGKKSGIVSALGIASGALLHCLFATLGLSVLIAKSELAFSLIKYIGAAYLFYLGIMALLSKTTGIQEPLNTFQNTKQYFRIYVSGILTNLLNPKISLFFLAFLPQFIDPNYDNNAISFLVLGLTFVTTGTLWCLFLAFFSAKFANNFRKHPKIQSVLNTSTGVLFVFLGIQLALTQK